MNDNDEKPMDRKYAKWGLTLGVAAWINGLFLISANHFWYGVLGLTFGSFVIGVCFAFLDYYNLFVKTLPPVGQGKPPGKGGDWVPPSLFPKRGRRPPK